MLKSFEPDSNINRSNQVLRKLVKLASSQNVNSLLDSRVQTKTLCSLQGVFLYRFLKSVQNLTRVLSSS